MADLSNRIEDYDVLIVGSGTGLAAAIAAHDKGLKPLVVEKTELVGGSAARSGGGIWVPGNHVLERDGAKDSIEKARTYITSVVDGKSPAAKLEAYLEHGRAAIQLLEQNTNLRFTWDKGYSDYFPELPGGSAPGRSIESKPFNVNRLGEHLPSLRKTVMESSLPMPVMAKDYKWLNLITKKPIKGMRVAISRLFQGLGGKIIGRKYASGGYALMAGMYEAILKKNITLWLNTPLKSLIVEDGRAVGAIISKNGADVEVRPRKGIILAAGGYDHDMEMRQKFQSEILKDWSLGSSGNTGDGIKAGMEIGTDLANMRQAWWFPAFAPLKEGEYPITMLAERSLPGSFIVDKNGKRFINEAINYMSYGQHLLAREDAGDPVGDMWMIFDKQYRSSYLLAGEMPGNSVPQEWFDAGNAVQASSWKELADKIGVDPGNLEATGKRFNDLAASGVDTDFQRGESAYDRYYGDPTQKPNPNLRPVNQAELFALRVVLSDLGTCGGIRTDENAQALDTNGKPIDGLYTIGNNAGNFFGEVYPGAGATLGQGIVGGYLAVRHMIAEG